MFVKNKYRLIIPLPVYLRLRAYVEAVDYEISGLGMLTTNEHEYGADFILDEIFLIKQKCSAAETTIAPEGIALLIDELLTTKKDTGHLKLWWHSHGKMDVFWSNVDVLTIKNLTQGKGWMLSLVGNIQGELLARLDVYQTHWMTELNVEVKVHFPIDEVLAEQVRVEVTDKVTEIIFKPKRLWQGGIWNSQPFDEGFPDFGGFPYDNQA